MKIKLVISIILSFSLLCCNKNNNAFFLNENLSLIKEDKNFTAVDKTGKKMFTLYFDTIESLPFLISNKERAKIEKENFHTDSINFHIEQRLKDAKKWVNKKKYFKIKKDNKYGVLGINGIETFPIIYDDIDYMPSTNIFLLKTKGKWGGLIIQNGGMYISSQPIFDEITELEETKDFLLGKINGKYGYIDNQLTPKTGLYDSLGVFNSNGTDFINNGKKGKLIMSTRVDRFVEAFSKEEEEVYHTKKVWPNESYEAKWINELGVGKLKGIWNRKTDEILIEKKYKRLNKFIGEDHIVFIAKDDNGDVGAFNAKGEVIIPFIYKDIIENNISAARHISTGQESEYNVNNFILKTKDDKFGLVRIDGKEIIPNIYDKIKAVNKSDFILKKDKFCSYYNTTKDSILLKLEADDVSLFYNNLIVFKKDKGYSIIRNFDLKDESKSYKNRNSTRQGLIMSDPEFNYYSPFGEIIIEPYKLNSHYQLQQKLPELFYTKEIKDNQGRVQTKYGYKDSTTTNFIPPVYSQIEQLLPNNLNFFRVLDDNKYGVIDARTQMLIIPPKYSVLKRFYPFDDKFIVSENHKKYGMIDKNNTIIIPFEYERISRFKHLNSDNQDRIQETATPYLVQIEKDGNVGLMDYEGKTWVLPEYQSVYFPRKSKFGFAIVVTKDGKKGIYSCKSGKLPEQFFDYLEYNYQDESIKVRDKNIKYKATLIGDSELRLEKIK